MLKRISAKLGNMRKPQNFVVYPKITNAPKGTMQIQSDKRICRFDATTGEGMLSAHQSNGAYGHHLSEAAGAMKITVPQEVIAAAKAAQPQSGDTIGGIVRIA